MMDFHSEDDLRKLGQEVANAAEDAVAEENGHNADITSGAWQTGDFYSGYPDLFAAFATRDPHEMQPSLTMLGRVTFELTKAYPVSGNPDVPIPENPGNLPDISTPETIAQLILTRDIRNWSGTASEAFAKVLASLPETTKNQALAVNTLAATLSMQMNLRSKFNDDVWKLGQSAITSFKKIGGFPPSGEDVQMALTCITAAITAWSVFSTAGAVTLELSEEGAVIGASTATNLGSKDVGTAISTLNTVGKTADAEFKVTPSDGASGIDKKLKASLAAAATSYRNQEQAIVTAMSQFTGGIQTNSGIFVLDDPSSVKSLDGEQVGQANDEYDPSKHTLHRDFHDTES
jgi:hypothetical protein